MAVKTVEHVILFVPGTHRFAGAPDIDRMAEGLAKALEKELDAELRPEPEAQALRFDGATIRGRDIAFVGADSKPQLIHIYECDYYDIFTEMEAKWLPVYVGTVLFMVVVNAGLALRPVGRILRQLAAWILRTLGLPVPEWIAPKSAPSVSWVQLAYIVILVAVNLLVPAVLLWLLWQWSGEAGKAAVEALFGAAASGETRTGGSAAADATGTVLRLGAFFALTQVVWKYVLSDGVREFIRGFSRDPVIMLQYFTGRPRGRSVRRRVLGRIDRLYRFARWRHPHAEVHMVAYSFGAAAALDWLYPPNEPADNAPLVRERALDTLVTLGLPYEMVTTFWPRYYEDGREFECTEVGRLATVSLARDVVGSALPAEARIVKEARAQRPPVTVERHDTEELPSDWKKRGPWFVPLAVKAHGQYFGFGDEYGSPAFARCLEATGLKRRSDPSERNRLG